MSIENQIEYWKRGASEAVETAELLIQNKKLLHGLFFCHLVIEKILKSHVVKFTGNVPPKTHNLFVLLKKTDLVLTNEEKDFFGILMNYQLEGRYPEFYPKIPSYSMCNSYLVLTKKLWTWIEEQL